MTAVGDRVRVAVCTHRRNDALERLLGVLTQLADTRYRSWRLGLTVVDDSADGAAQEVADRYADRFAEGLQYHTAGAGNVAHARNEALGISLERDDWVAFLDDDELPTESWLDELFTVQARTDADIVVGVVRPQWPQGTPRWLIDSGFQHAPEYDNYSEPPQGITGNSLLRVAWLRDAGTRFDEQFGPSGGEDTVFFAAARDRGARIRYASQSIVYEDVLPNRATLSYQLRRELRTGQQMTRSAPRVEGLSRPRLLARAGRAAIGGSASAASGAIRGDRAAAARGLGRVVRGGGVVLGLLGVQPRHS